MGVSYNPVTGRETIAEMRNLINLCVDIKKKLDNAYTAFEGTIKVEAGTGTFNTSLFSEEMYYDGANGRVVKQITNIYNEVVRIHTDLIKLYNAAKQNAEKPAEFVDLHPYTVPTL